MPVKKEIVPLFLQGHFAMQKGKIYHTLPEICKEAKPIIFLR